MQAKFEQVPLEYWNQAYKNGEYLEKWDYDYPSQELVAVLATLNLPPKSCVLDLGCGAGRDTVFLSSLGMETIGIDICYKAIQVAQKRDIKAKVHWLVGDVLQIPFRDDSFDFISDRACFHHIHYEDRALYVKEIVRILKTNGYLLLRGSRKRNENQPFFPITEEAIDKYFSLRFQRGPVLPIELMNNSGKLEGNIVLMKKVK